MVSSLNNIFSPQLTVKKINLKLQATKFKQIPNNNFQLSKGTKAAYLILSNDH